MGSKNKAMYKDHIKPLYRWWEEATKDDGNGQSKKFPDIKPIEFSSAGDMSATWKMLGKSGTAKIKTCFITVVTISWTKFIIIMSQIVMNVMISSAIILSGKTSGNVTTRR